MSKQTSRIFQEMPLIEKLLHQSISNYDPTSDDAIVMAIKELQHREVPDRADNFVITLYAIIEDMSFSDWQDFWLDMGIRIYDAEEDWELLPTTECVDDTDYDEDDNELHEFHEFKRW